ncbi:MAG TPA: beta-(1-6) glucans synthase [Xanthobacteraceae bacterium]|nr:beta-(1-6) glucans synthase [Xanthobacteraceae bacterium]
MKRVAGLFLLSAGLIVVFWWWLGRPVPVTVNALGPGEKIECLSYSPYRDGQTPLDLSTRIDPDRIDDDLRRLSAVTGCVRTYSVHQGLDQVVPIAKTHGLKVLQGLWLGRDQEFNRKQIAAAIALTNQYPEVIRAVVVGNEVLLRGEMSATALAEIIRSVKRQVPVPVTYADVWEFWLRNRDLLAAVDFVTVHILPYWEDFPIAADLAADHVMSIRRQVGASFPDKEILIGEVGWPSQGRMREGALPSPSNQARVLREVIAKAKQEQFQVNLIEAFDQPWKRRFEGTVGGYWGLFDGEKREPKFAWDRPVSDHPRWKLGAAMGIVLSLTVFALAFAVQKRRSIENSSPRIWAGVTAIATIAGGLYGLTIEQAETESLGLGGTVRSLAFLCAAAGAPVIGAAALASGVPVPPFAQALGRRAQWPRDRLALATSLALAIVTLLALQAALGLVFDPRYRDFPSAALTAAAAPFLILTITRGHTPGAWPMAERLGAATLIACAVYIVLNETFANWQALWFAAALTALSATLAASRAARS